MTNESFDKEFSKPFNRDGEPQKYLRLIIPFFDKEFARKADMLKLMGVDIEREPHRRNTHSTTLAKLSRAGILETKPRGDGFWRRGPRWNEFLTWISLSMLKNPTMRSQFKNMLIKYETNSLEFFMKD